MPELQELPALLDLARPGAYMARHSRSFRFATAFMSEPERLRLERVYAWCRYTDDLVDRAATTRTDAAAQLEAWMSVSRDAYQGIPSGIPVVDAVMAEMAERDVPFTYAEALAEGMRSDLEFRDVETRDDLSLYTYRVAGVVGQWLTELNGVRDTWVLERAASLGHAMQLTNILRDVGEDLDRGRIYLPRDAMARHGVTRDGLADMRRGGHITRGYVMLIEELMADATHHYRRAQGGVPALPPDFRRAVTVAAAVYGGILDEIRRNRYDNFRRRAATTTARKMTLALSVLLTSSIRSPLGERAAV